MVDYKKILLLRADGVSQRGIADVLGCSRNTVAAVVAAADSKNMVWEEVADLDSSEVRHLLLPEPAGREPGRVAPDFQHVQSELTRPGVTLLLLWTEYASKVRAADGIPYQYSFFNEQYRRWVAAAHATMTIPRVAGDTTEVDWAGDPMEYVDPVTGEIRDGWLFVAVLSYSAYGYVQACPDMTLDSWPAMIDEQTLNRLKMMRLSGMADCYDQLASTPSTTPLTGPELVKLGVDWEWERRRNSKLSRLRRRAHLAQPHADIADIQPVPGRDLLNVSAVIREISASRLSERGATRADDRISDTSMEDRKREGYF